VDSEDVFYTNGRYAVIHAASSGEKTIRLPKKASAFEVYEEKYYSHDQSSISLTMVKGETKMFELR
jgi:hypothetical protein